VLVPALGACGEDSGSIDTRSKQSQPAVTIEGARGDGRRYSQFVSCLERAGFRVTVHTDRKRGSSSETYFYDFGKATPKQEEARDRCSVHFAESLRERVDELGHAEPEIERLGSDQISVGLPGVRTVGLPRVSARTVRHDSKAICSRLGASALASAFGTSTKPAEIAEAFADEIGRTWHQPVFDGCQDGLRSP